MRRTLAVIAALSFGLLRATPAGAFPPIQRGPAEAVTVLSTAGATSYRLTFAYPIQAWDATLGYTWSTGASAFEIGGRYYFPPHPGSPSLYAGLNYSSMSVGGVATSGIVLEAGAAKLLAPGLQGYAGLSTSPSGGGLGYEVGVQYWFAPRTSAWLGVIGTSGGSSSVYLGVNFRHY